MSDDSVFYLGEKSDDNDLEFEAMVSLLLNEEKHSLATQLAREKLAVRYWRKSSYETLEDCARTLGEQGKVLVTLRSQVLNLIEERQKEYDSLIDQFREFIDAAEEREIMHFKRKIELRIAAIKNGPKARGAEGGKKRLAPEKRLATELGLKFLAECSKKPYRIDVARAILPEINMAGRKRGVALSEVGGVETVKGWLKETIPLTRFKK